MNPSTAYAHAGALATTIAGYIIGFVPSWAPDKQILIAGGSVVVAAAILFAHAIRNRPAGQTVIQAAEKEAATVAPEIDYNKVVAGVVKELTTTTAGLTPTPVKADTPASMG